MPHPAKLTVACFVFLEVLSSAQAQAPPWLQIALTNARPQILISSSTTGYVHQVQWAAALTSSSNAWQVLTNLTVPYSPFAWVDTSAAGVAERYYRVVMLTTGQPTNPDPLRLVWIPAGTFTLGSPESEPERSSNEGPQTSVTLTKGFFMSKHLTTQGDYLRIMGSNPSRFTGDTNRPVERVTWFNSSNYCVLLTQAEQAAGRLPAGWRYRLPTEAEWEYACRAGTTNMFSYGDDPNYTALGAYAWFDANSGFTTHPVGQKLPNPWGLYDMHGNLAQWCLNWYASTHPGGNVTDPTGPVGPAVSRVIRGAGYFYSGSACRSAYRYPWVPAGSDSSIGFRVVLAESP